MLPAAHPTTANGCNFFVSNAISHWAGRPCRAERRLAVELHVPVAGLAIRKANPGNTVQE